MTNKCEVCLNEPKGPIIDLGAHPLNDDMRPVGTPASTQVYRQVIQLCDVCLTAQQVYQVPKETLFFPEYRYRGSVTSDVVIGMKNLVENALGYYGEVSNLKVLDIGANDGTLLGLFKEQSGCQTIGVDPTNAIQYSESRIDYAYQEFFDHASAEKIVELHGQPDIITFTNVFAHIENFSELLNALEKLINDTNLLVIENHYLGSVLEKNQFDTFYAEHLRTYSAKSFEFIAKRLNVEIKSLQFPRRYGGNIRVFLSRKSTLPISIENNPEGRFIDDFETIQQTYDQWKAKSKAEIDKLLKSDTLIGKSCPARSVMLYSSLEMNVNKMEFVYEHPKSPKIGWCVPGTSIPIISDETISKSNQRPMILWSWHIAYEIIPYLKSLGFKGKVYAPLPEFKLLAEL